jgi:hypothetical protein
MFLKNQFVHSASRKVITILIFFIWDLICDVAAADIAKSDYSLWAICLMFSDHFSGCRRSFTPYY